MTADINSNKPQEDDECSGRSSSSSSAVSTLFASPNTNHDTTIRKRLETNIESDNRQEQHAESNHHQTVPTISHMSISIREGDDNDDTKSTYEYCNEEEPITIPQSTHSLLFTEDINSLPFLFSLYITVISYICLILALINNLQNGKIPANVDLSVRIAQYMSILVSKRYCVVQYDVCSFQILGLFGFSYILLYTYIHNKKIALLMEEEIPTGLYLLRRISKPYLESKFPEVQYPRFVMSSILRITIGYLFLINVILVLIQADVVIEIFYDVLALQFIQQLGNSTS